MTKLIGIEEHFVTADIRAAWAASRLLQKTDGTVRRTETGASSRCGSPASSSQRNSTGRVETVWKQYVKTPFLAFSARKVLRRD